MSRFSKYIICGLLIDPFFGISSVAAMERTNNNPSDIHLKRGYAALDIIELRGKNKETSSIECFFSATKREDLFLEFKDVGNSFLLEVVEMEFNLALQFGNPYAASALTHIYTLEDNAPTAKQVTRFLFLKQMFPFNNTILGICVSFYYESKKDMLKEALLKSIHMKKESGVKTGFNEDTELLIEVKGGNLLNMVSIKRTEEMNMDKAISCYGYLSWQLNAPETNDAFDALMRLQENPSTWFYLARACFARARYEEGLNWMDKVVLLERTYFDDVQWELKKIVENEKVPFSVQLRAARMEYEYAQKNSRGEKIVFSAALRYYELLKVAKAHGIDFSDIIDTLGKTLIITAEESNDPELLFKLATAMEKGLKENNDKFAIFDMYRRAANKGCKLSLNALINSPESFVTMGVEKAAVFLAQHNQGQQLLDFYTKMDNPVFLVLLSLMSKNEEFKKQADNLLLEYADSYALAMDVKIHQLVQSKNLSEHEHYNMTQYKGSSNPPQWCCELREKDKRIEAEKQEKIKEIQARKMKVIDILSDEEQFHLAQEYLLVNEAFNIPSFLEGYFLLLEKSAEKGYLAAVEELVERYTTGYLQRYEQGKCIVFQFPKKASFYKGIQAILKDTELSSDNKAELCRNAYAA